MEKRIAWIDVVRGLGILLVVVAHSVAPDSLWAKGIFLFHMPLFFILSGYGFQASTPAALFMQKRFRALMAPYFATVVIIYLYWLHFCFMMTGAIEGWDRIAIMFHGMALYGSGILVPQFPDVVPIGVMWFLPALFVANCLYMLLVRASERLPRSEWALGWLVAIVSVAGVFLGKAIFLPWSFDIAMVAQLFLWFGHMAHKHGFFNRPPRPGYVLLVAALLYCGWTYGGISMNNRDYDALIIPASSAIAGSCALIWLSQLLTRVRPLMRLFTYIGHAAIIILCFHIWDVGYSYSSQLFPALIEWLVARPPLLILERMVFCMLLYEIIRRIPLRLRRLYLPSEGAR